MKCTASALNLLKNKGCQARGRIPGFVSFFPSREGGWERAIIIQSVSEWTWMGDLRPGNFRSWIWVVCGFGGKEIKKKLGEGRWSEGKEMGLIFGLRKGGLGEGGLSVCERERGIGEDRADEIWIVFSRERKKKKNLGI